MTVDLFLLRTALRDVVRPRRLTTAIVLALLPSAIGLLWRTLANKNDFVPGDAYNALAASLIFGFILTILSVIYGTGVVSQEIEQRTIVYLLTRPVPRWRILLAKFVGSTLAITLTVWISAVLLAVAVYGPGRAFSGPLARDLRILPIGALAYGSVFLLLATLLPRPLTFGLLFAFGWEALVPSLPGSFGRLSIMSHLRALAPHIASEKSSFLDLFDTDIRPWQAWLVLGLVISIALLAALVAFSTREYAPREDTE